MYPAACLGFDGKRFDAAHQCGHRDGEFGRRCFRCFRCRRLIGLHASQYRVPKVRFVKVVCRSISAAPARVRLARLDPWRSSRRD
ncbi:Uncharacterised protein [Mycobacteroides abscessus subsp. abscessus]|nr:Uncharacterised protein [Mycobacteroides abscessus subsp. abscessus]